MRNASAGSDPLFDLADLDPLAQDLDLAVGTTEADQLSGGVYVGKVTGAKPSCGGEARESDAGKSLRRLLLLVEVLEGHPVAADPELADLAVRERSAVLVDDGHLGAGERSADGHRGRPLGHLLDQPPGGEGGALSRSVPVEQAAGR